MYSGPVIDCDVHHARNTDAELIEYLSPGWRQYVTDRGPAGNVPLAVQDGLPNPHAAVHPIEQARALLVAVVHLDFESPPVDQCG